MLIIRLLGAELLIPVAQTSTFYLLAIRILGIIHLTATRPMKKKLMLA